jgi:hypothetical protein
VVYRSDIVGFKSIYKHFYFCIPFIQFMYVSKSQKLCRHSVINCIIAFCIALMFWFIQVSVVSLIIIFVLHNLYSFFKETLTVPKIKDMVKRPQQKYDMLFRELRNQGPASSSSNSNGNGNEDMKNELKRYLMDLNSTAQPQPQSQQYPQPQYTQPQYPQPQSDFIELGSTYQ